jgi:DNA-3-methyladenine glycosylase I
MVNVPHPVAIQPRKQKKVSLGFVIMTANETAHEPTITYLRMSKPQSESLVKGPDGVLRCWWCGDDPQYVEYHDTEWGNLVDDDRRLFEKICLEGFQAGLSWLTILRKRAAFREAFADFDFRSVAQFKPRDVEKLIKNAAIVRHRGKIESTINNARRAIELVEESGSLHEYFGQFKPSRRLVITGKSDIAVKTPESTAMSKDLKNRGWSFVGPTTCYAFMQAMGLVNDHIQGCRFRKPIKLVNP